MDCRNSCSSAKYCSDFSVTGDFVSRSPENTKEREKFNDLQNLGKYQSKPHKIQPNKIMTMRRAERHVQSQIYCVVWNSYCINSFQVFGIPSDPTCLCHLLPGFPFHCHFTTPGDSDKAAAPLLGPAPLAPGQQLPHTSKGSYTVF